MKGICKQRLKVWLWLQVLTPAKSSCHLGLGLGTWLDCVRIISSPEEESVYIREVESFKILAFCGIQRGNHK